mmetsp:Transcript_3383/g.8443  ORF Transcript_3383/g.8443 Transcript_3383/m.8443 type:complete len:168 (+) Transcript_3383:58-561(+)
MVRALDTGRYHRQKRELRDTQLSEIRDSFELFDQDGAGTVQAKDLTVLLRALGSEPSKLEIKRFLANVDGANTGQLDFDNYLQIVLDKLGEKPTVEEVSKAFRLFAEGDNESGRISFDRLKQIAEEIGETIADEELREMISEADQSGTGTVSNDDFLRIITSRHRTT